MKKLPQKGLGHLLHGIGSLDYGSSCGRFGSRLDREIAAVRNFLGLLMTIGNLHHGQDFGGPRAGIRTHRLGVHLNINVVAVLDQRLKLNSHVGLVLVATLIRLLNHQHY